MENYAESIISRVERSRQYRWDRRNIRTVSTHLTVRDAERLKDLCKIHRISRYHLLHWFLTSIIWDPVKWSKVLFAMTGRLI